MKIARSRLRKLIREELEHLFEQEGTDAPSGEIYRAPGGSTQGRYEFDPLRLISYGRRETVQGTDPHTGTEHSVRVSVVEVDGQEFTMGKLSEIEDWLAATVGEGFLWDAVEGAMQRINSQPGLPLSDYGEEHGLMPVYQNKYRKPGEWGPSTIGHEVSMDRSIETIGQRQLYIVPVGCDRYYVVNSEVYNNGRPHIIKIDISSISPSLDGQGGWVGKLKHRGFRTEWLVVLDERHVNGVPEIDGCELKRKERCIKNPEKCEPPPPPDPIDVGWELGADAVEPGPIDSGSERNIYAIYNGAKIPVISLERYQVLEGSGDYEDQDLADRIMAWRDGQVSNFSDQEDILTRISVRFPIPGDYYMPDDLQDDWRTNPVFTDDEISIFDEEGV